jgi:hypothetical protein
MLIGKPEAKRIAAISVRRLTLTLSASLCALAGGLSLWSAPALACPNEDLRAASAASLPDCRAYEMVSPPAKNGYFVTSAAQIVEPWAQASPVGGAVAYTVNGALPGSASNSENYYLASRGEAGWSARALIPPQSFSYGQTATDPTFAAFSSDLSKGILLDATDSPSLISGEPETTQPQTANLFLRDNAASSYSLLNAAAPGLNPNQYRPLLDGVSADFATVIFDAHAALTPEAPGGGIDDLYQSAAGALSLVSQIPPAGEPSCGPAGPACLPAPHGGEFGSANAVSFIAAKGSLVHVISSDGSRIFFTTEGNLYVRENATTTVQLDASHGAGPGGGGVFATAAGDGSQAFFYDDASAGLTAGTVPGSGRNLYDYHILTKTLTDLTPSPEAGVLGVVNQASEDGSYLYFVANGVLTGAPNSLAQTASPGRCVPFANPNGASCNLYLSHDGAISFVHTVVDPSEEAYSSTLDLQHHSASRITPDGRHLAFFAEDRGATGTSEPRFAELFEYSADSGQLSHLCACFRSNFPQPSPSQPIGQLEGVFQYTRALSDDGARVFFDSEEALLPGDTNGQPDVYEYERGGTGSCAVASGCLYLISSGTGTRGSYFADASASGDDVFFSTSQQLVPSDTDAAYDLYDARVGGGLGPSPSPASCLGDACLNVSPAPIDATPGSLTFSGAGNFPGEVKAQITPKAKLTNAQKLAKAVKACGKKRKRQRKSCEAQAHKRYARKAGKSARARRVNTNRRAGT